MTRPLVLSNGSMHVGINLFGMVHDFYYPYVGWENHATTNNMRWRIGVWIDQQFSWLDDGSWQFEFDYETDAMVEHTEAVCARLQVKLDIRGCVDSEYDAFMRTITVTNKAEKQREVRLFLHQVLRISNNLNGDTAQYLPVENAILHYKANRVFVFGSQDERAMPFNQYSVGVYGIEGKEGTYRDAEDGVLSGNAVEHGNVDSVMGFNLQLEPNKETTVSYWVAVGMELHASLHCFKAIRHDGVSQRIKKTAEYWHQWLQPASNFVDSIPSTSQAQFKKNLLIIKAHIDKRGALIASTDTTMRNYSRDAYTYCWPRDAALSLWPMLRLGYVKEVKDFFHFCRQVLQPEGFLMHKYLSDGSIGSSWHPYVAEGRVVPPIQEDETAIVVFLFGQYLQLTNDKDLLHEFYDSLIRPAANFMAGYIDEFTKLPHATYDIWEEKLLTTTYTTAVTYAALVAAAHMAETMGRQRESVQWQAVADDIYTAAQTQLFDKEKNFFIKGFIRKHKADGTIETEYDKTIDVSSFYGAFMFGLFDLDSSAVQQSFMTLQRTFNLGEQMTPIPRYEHDNYRRTDTSSIGNPWFITTLWIAQYYMEIGNKSKAQEVIDFVQQCMLGSGVLSEQIDPITHKFVCVAPLTWSQAEYINTVIDLYQKITSTPKV